MNYLNIHNQILILIWRIKIIIIIIEIIIILIINESQLNTAINNIENKFQNSINRMEQILITTINSLPNNNILNSAKNNKYFTEFGVNPPLRTHFKYIKI